MPPTPTPVSYSFTASLDQSSYYWGETAQVCYTMSPPNIGFDLYFSQASPRSGLIAAWSDNGIGGGDCVSVKMESIDLGEINVMIQAVINGQTFSRYWHIHVSGIM